MTVTLHHGDCLQILPTLTGIDAVVSDPPWGVDADTDYTRFTNGLSDSRNFGAGIEGDSTPFDAAPWLKFPHVALWGANCFCDQLPMGMWLVWLKKRESQIGTFMSDAELCWVKHKRTPRRAPGVYVMQHAWHGFDRQTERGKTLHPTQKPVALMRWVIERLDLKPGSTILDPYMGSGSTGVAAVELGFNFVGCEIDRDHFETARRRIDAAERQAVTPLFDARPARRLPQASLFDAEVRDGGGP